MMCKTQMYTSPIMLGYCFHQAMGQFVKCAKEEEFTAVKNAVVRVLGLETTMPTEANAIPMDYIDHMEALKHEMALMENELEAREKANELLRKSLEETSREADKAGIYKEMYMTLLDKIISARGEA